MSVEKKTDSRWWRRSLVILSVTRRYTGLELLRSCMDLDITMYDFYQNLCHFVRREVPCLTSLSLCSELYLVGHRIQKLKWYFLSGINISPSISRQKNDLSTKKFRFGRVCIVFRKIQTLYVVINKLLVFWSFIWICIKIKNTTYKYANQDLYLQ